VNLNNSDIKRAFKGHEVELEAFRQALHRDETIVPCLIRILESRLSDTQFNFRDLDESNYTHRRDIKTGREFEIRKLLTKLYEDTPSEIKGFEKKGS